MVSKRMISAVVAVVAASAACVAGAADWSDTALTLHYGTRFAEPYDNNDDGSRKDITKEIVSLTYVNGYQYGSNFLNLDVLLSDRNDPAGGIAGNSGAREAYLVYRHLLDLGKVSGYPIKLGAIRGAGLTLGFDANTKNDGYGSRKRMLVAGPTLMLDVPGYMNVSVLVLDESNAPNGIPSRYHYKDHAAFESDWSIPIGSLPLSFNGYFLYIGSKGTDEVGGTTAPETHFDGQVMLDVGLVAGLSKKTFYLGAEYEYWRNKYGNPTISGGAGPGATARTPMIRAEYHF